MMSFEECQEWGRRMKTEREAFERKQTAIRNNKFRNQGINPINNKQPWEYDHPSTPDDGFVTFLYIVAMVGSLIFEDFWVLWIGLTVVYWKFITRHDND